MFIYTDGAILTQPINIPLGVLNQKGVVAPYSEDVNKPIMEALEKEGIKCVEEIL